MIIELSLKLAMVYAKMEEREKAESGFAFCLMMQQQNCAGIPNDGVEGGGAGDGSKPPRAQLSEEDHNSLALLGVVQNSYAHYEFLEGHLPAGRKLLEAALKTARRVYAPYHANCIHLLSDLANVESRLEMPKNARARLEQAVDLLKSVSCPASKREKQECVTALCSLYCQWALLEANQGAFRVANKYLAEAQLLTSQLSADARQQCQEQMTQVEAMIQRWQGMEACMEDLLVPNEEC
ncbi:unnamed protein product [Dibothriocephalus latus]|uniref:KIF-binding protein n=1 Tax=Dibothriocephalus latus TaxID=60516 RepID=A0A3P7M8V4_DIBLA|nr:unnamed protein product [Dibothriocephalus latus]